MAQIISEFLVWLGLTGQPLTFADLITWFVAVMIGMRIICYVIDSMFYVLAQLRR